MPEVTCPRCEVRIPDDMALCPFCKQPVAPPPEGGDARDIRPLLVQPETFPALKRFYREHGKRLKLALPLLVAIPTLWILFLVVTGMKVEIPEDPVFPIEVKHEKSAGRTVLLKGTLTNLGEDIPDLSLQSIGVTAEFRWRDGKVERKRIFPKSQFRGEGALFRGESGTFEIEVPKGASAVTLRAGIVDLGEGRRFELPRQKTLPPPRTRN